MGVGTLCYVGCRMSGNGRTFHAYYHLPTRSWLLLGAQMFGRRYNDTGIWCIGKSHYAFPGAVDWIGLDLDTLKSEVSLFSSEPNTGGTRTGRWKIANI